MVTRNRVCHVFVSGGLAYLPGLVRERADSPGAISGGTLIIDVSKPAALVGGEATELDTTEQ